MSRFIETLATSRIDGTYLKVLNILFKTPLLILDDWGLQPLDHNIRLTLLHTPDRIVPVDRCKLVHVNRTKLYH
jgi:hypothetical protein